MPKESCHPPSIAPLWKKPRPSLSRSVLVPHLALPWLSNSSSQFHRSSNYHCSSMARPRNHGNESENLDKPRGRFRSITNSSIADHTPFASLKVIMPPDGPTLRKNFSTSQTKGTQSTVIDGPNLFRESNLPPQPALNHRGTTRKAHDQTPLNLFDYSPSTTKQSQFRYHLEQKPTSAMGLNLPWTSKQQP